MILSIVARISDELEEGTCEVASSERYIGSSENGVTPKAAFSSFSLSFAARYVNIDWKLQVEITYLPGP